MQREKKTEKQPKLGIYDKQTKRIDRYKEN